MYNQSIHFETGLKSDYHLRKMEAQDIEQVWQLERSIFPSPWSLESFYLELKNRHISHPYVIEHRQKVVAYMIYWRIGTEIHIANIAVHKSHRRQRLALSMLRYLLKTAMEHPIKNIYLEVRKSNRAAILLYKKLGFQITGIRKNYYQAENEDALLMSCQMENINQNIIME